MLSTNIAGAIGLAQLDRIDSLQSLQKAIWGTYWRVFAATRSIVIRAEITEDA